MGLEGHLTGQSRDHTYLFQADPVRETFSDLDSNSEYMEISVDPDKGLKFATKGVYCTSEVSPCYLRPSSAFHVSFLCRQSS